MVRACRITLKKSAQQIGKQAVLSQAYRSVSDHCLMSRKSMVVVMGPFLSWTMSCGLDPQNQCLPPDAGSVLSMAN